MKATILVLLLALGMVALPASEVVPEQNRSTADAHVATGGVKAKKLEKLSGRTYRGYVTAWIDNIPGEIEFDDRHVHERQLIAYVGQSYTKKGPYKIVGRTMVIERWNQNYSSGPLRPRISCVRGTWIRAVGVHRVRYQPTLELAGGIHVPIGSIRQSETVDEGPRRKCQ